MVILVDRPNTSIRHNSPLEINIGQISSLFLTAFSIKKNRLCDRECVLECTENIRFISQEYTQKLGFLFPLQIPLVRLPPRLRPQRSTCRLGSLLNSWSYHAIREKSTASNNRPPAPLWAIVQPWQCYFGTH